MRHGLTYAPHIPGAVLDDTEQCLAELVANNVVHGTRPQAKSYRPGTAFVHVTVIDLGDGLRIEVIDQDTKSKKPTIEAQHPQVLEVSGRGLLIVDALSRCWSHYEDPHGRTTFCELTYLAWAPFGNPHSPKPPSATLPKPRRLVYR